MDDSSKTAKKGEHWTPSSCSSGITDLPSHILMEILFRLSIKTQVATKSVCKSWLHLINGPFFAKLHQPRANVEICFQRYKYSDAYFPKLRMGNFYFTQTSHSLDLNLDTVIELPSFGGNMTRFVNSCNGLLCYSCGISNFALIWNPITSEFLTVPSPSRERRAGLSMTYGFGFIQKMNRFKLLCIYIQNSPEKIIATEICTIKKQGCSWRTIESCPYPVWDTFGQTIFFRGALHWFSNNKYRDISIVSFDLDDEKFAGVPLPPHFNTTCNINYHFNKIGVLKDCLFVTDMTDGSFNIWLMKDYGDEDSWTRVICSEIGPNYCCCMPLHYLDNGEIMMMRVHHPACLVVYCPDSKKRPSTITSNVDPMDRVITFNPSLVPLGDFIME